MTIAIVLVSLVVVSTAIGLIWRSTTGRSRAVHGKSVDIPEVPLESAVTLLQFSTQFCAPCKSTHTLLGSISSEYADVSHVDIDLSDRPDLAARFNILQTPTTFVLDQQGVVRARIGGAVRKNVIVTELSRVLGADFASTTSA